MSQKREVFEQVEQSAVPLPDFLDDCVHLIRLTPDEPRYVVNIGPAPHPGAAVLYLPANWTIERFLAERMNNKWQKLRRRAS